MEKMTSTGRETYNSQIGGFTANYTKTTTANNVVVVVNVSGKDEAVVYNLIYDKEGNRCTGGFRRFGELTAAQREAIVTQVIKDLNTIV